MTEQLAVDISNYQGDPAQEVFDSWYAEGARTVICGTDDNQSSPMVFPQQAEKAKAAGMAVEAYIYLYFGSGGQPYDVVQRTNQKLDMIEQVGDIRRVWVDCEDTTSGLAPQVLVGLIANAIDAVSARGFEVGMYTGAWWWVPNTANSTLFSPLPLWAADYDGQQDLELTNPFGGWTSLYRKQYTEHGRLGAYPTDLDLNVEFVAEAAEPQPIDDYSKQLGRSEMLGGIIRDMPNVPVAQVMSWLEARYSEWGVQP